jgi:hypothetical protein
VIERSRLYRLIAILCLAAILLAALTPAASGQFAAVLVPLWFFCVTTVIFSIRRWAEPVASTSAPYLPLVASRPPPLA